MDSQSKDLVPIRRKGRAVAPHKAIIAPVIGARNVLTNSPWTYVALWLKRGRKDKALLYWQQVQEFYKVSLGLPTIFRTIRYYGPEDGISRIIEAVDSLRQD
jgi:hypothetical protein